MKKQASKQIETKANTKKLLNQRETALEITAKNFIDGVKSLQSDKELEKIQRYFKSGKGEYSEGDTFIGVRMGHLFALAKEFVQMQPGELKKLLNSPIHEVRAGALSIMDKQGRNNKTTDERRKELYDLYLKSIKKINNWDLVDLGAPFVIGRYLFDKPRTVLYKLAKSKDVWQRRTAIVSTAYFIRQGDLHDTFTIGELLLYDKHDLIQKATGGWLREAGKQDRSKLLKLLDRHAATLPRTLLRYAIEHFDKKIRDHYLSLRKV